jgi:hypothetical protein
LQSASVVVASLTRQERKYWDEHLMGPAGAARPAGVSGENFRKLKQRVLHKFHRFLNRQ